MDGVVVIHPAVYKPIETLATLVHEVGHWCVFPWSDISRCASGRRSPSIRFARQSTYRGGLWHTFTLQADISSDNGCGVVSVERSLKEPPCSVSLILQSQINDNVTDTPAHNGPTRQRAGKEFCWQFNPPLDTCTGVQFPGIDPGK